MKDLYNENFKALKTELKKIPEDRNTSHAHELVELILWKWLSYQKQSRESVQSPIKKPMQLFKEIENIFINFL